MVTIKSLLEEADEKHVKEERDYFEYGIKCLEGLLQFVEKEDDDADGSRKKEYERIAKETKALKETMQKHIDGYEDEDKS